MSNPMNPDEIPTRPIRVTPLRAPRPSRVEPQARQIPIEIAMLERMIVALDESDLADELRCILIAEGMRRATVDPLVDAPLPRRARLGTECGK